MSDISPADRMQRALARIEAALRRIEAARVAPGLPFGNGGGSDPELQARYDALQAEAAAALAQIEAVLGTLEKDAAP